MPKSTVADWIEDFNVYIPKIKQGNITFYNSDTIEVLLFIRKCREKNYQKNQIMQLLSENGFPITVNEVIEDMEKIVEGDNPREKFLKVMENMSESIEKIGEQQKALKEHDKSIKSLKEKQIEQQNRLDEINQMREKLNRFEKELASTKEELKEEKNMSLFKKLFRKNKKPE